MCTTKYKNEDNTSKNKSYIFKKRSNNKVSFVEFILNSRQFKLMTTGYQKHGARWPRFNCVQMIEKMSLAAAMAKKMTELKMSSLSALRHAIDR